MNLPYPVSSKVKVIVEEVRCLCLRSHNEVILSLFEEPLGLLLLKQNAAFFNLVQLDNVTG